MKPRLASTFLYSWGKLEFLTFLAPPPEWSAGMNYHARVAIVNARLNLGKRTIFLFAGKQEQLFGKTCLWLCELLSCLKSLLLMSYIIKVILTFIWNTDDHHF